MTAPGATRPFRFGLVAKAARDRDEWHRLARDAESAGFDTLLMSDHARPQFAPFLGLLAAAAATSTLRVGTLVANTDLRNPVLLAHESATLDLLSGGRLELGLGAGWMRRDYVETGIRWDRGRYRAERFAETIEILRRLHAGETFSYPGRWHRLTDVVGGPLPVQRPLPLLIGAGGPAMLAVAARYAQVVSLARGMAAGASAQTAAQDITAAGSQAKIDALRTLAGDSFAAIELNVFVVRLVLGSSAAEAVAADAAKLGLSEREVRETPQHLFADDPRSAADELKRRRAVHGLSYVAFREEDLAAAQAVVAELRGG